MELQKTIQERFLKKKTKWDVPDALQISGIVGLSMNTGWIRYEKQRKNDQKNHIKILQTGIKQLADTR